MEEAAPAAAKRDAARGADSYIGSLISLITKSDIRYEGFLFHLDTQDSNIGLRNVKSFGTEGRRLDGTQVAPSDRIYEYIYFRGSDIKDLQVISSPPVQSTPNVPDDPAIIQSHHSLPPPATVSLASPSAFGGTNISSNSHLGIQVPPFQGNITPFQSVEVPLSWASQVPAPPANIDGPAMQSYWPRFTGLPGGNSHFQQQSFPPPPQGLWLSNPIQQQLPHPSMNASLAGNALNFTELPRTLLPPVCTGSFNLISTSSPPSTVQYSHIPLATLFSNLSSTQILSNTSNALPMEMVDSGSQMVSYSVSTSDVNSVVPPATDQYQSLLGPAPIPMISKSAPSTGGPSSEFRGKASNVSPATPGSFWQPGLLKPSSSHYFEAETSDANIILSSASYLQPSDSQNVEETASKLPATKLHEGASSSRYGNRRHDQGRGDSIYGNTSYSYLRNRGYSLGRGRGNVPNRASSQNYQTYRGHPPGRGRGLIGTAPYPRHVSRGHGRENAPNTVAPYNRHHAGSPAWGGSEAVTDFSEDFDFEAMYEKFNKEEVWGLLGKENQSESEDKKGDEKEGDGREAAKEVGGGQPKFDHKHGYCKDDFFDSLSCTALDGESGRGKLKFSEQRRIDAETFGEIQKPRRGRGIQGPYRGGFYQGSYRARGYDNAGRGRAKTVWSRVT